MAKEICRFINYLGYSTSVLRCDQEPAMLRVQDIAVSVLKKIGCKVLVENPKIHGHASIPMLKGLCTDCVKSYSSTELFGGAPRFGATCEPSHGELELYSQCLADESFHHLWQLNTVRSCNWQALSRKTMF